MAYQTICIVGMGLLGGSLGMALRRRRLAEHVIGVARRPESLARAWARGAIDEGYLAAPAAVAQADLTVLCVPVLSIASFLEALAPHLPAHGVVTDVGSTKAEITAAGERLLPDRFLGGHPMAGSEQAGIEAARADLFEGAWWALTPGPNAAPVEPLADLVQALGARPLVLPADEHDQAVAVTSHLPHAAAAALAGVVGDAFARNAVVPSLAAGSYRDGTRVAASSAELWRDVCLTNRGPLLEALQALQGRLDAVGAALRDGDAEAVARFFQQGAEAKRQVEDARRACLAETQVNAHDE